ncbi:MAG: hypothetical protein WD646_15155 [Actinomycetota bacterium]
MMNIIERPPGVDPITSPRPSTRREDLRTVLTASWLIIGLFLDGYAHQHFVTGRETFLTPWHAVFYAGFAATATSIALIVYRRPGRRLRDRIPAGYGSALLGLVGFAFGGISDGIWHSIFGVEVGIDALLSPTHLILMASLLAIVTAPYFAAVASTAAEARRGIALVSLGIGTALVAFFLNFVWGLGDSGFKVAYDHATGAGERDVIAGVASALVATFVLTIAARHAVRLGRPALGTFVMLFGLVSLAVHVAFEEEWIGVLSAVVAGLLLDAGFALRRPRAQPRVVFAVAIAAMWLTYFSLAIVTETVAWPAEIWIGTALLCALIAALLAPHAIRGVAVESRSGDNVHY